MPILFQNPKEKINKIKQNHMNPLKCEIKIIRDHKNSKSEAYNNCAGNSKLRYAQIIVRDWNRVPDRAIT